SATITGLTATDEGKLLKVFFIKDNKTLRPMELPLIQSRIYVAVDGNDNNDGTIDKPIKTPEKAIAKTKELNAIHQRDIVIYLTGGEYVIEDTIELDESFSGRDDCGVHFKSLTPSNPAVISGGYDVPEWSDDDGDGIYTALLPDTITDVRQLYINEEPAQRARGDYLFRASERWDDTDTEYEEDGFVVKNSQFPKLIKPKDAEIAYPILWTVQRLPLENITYDETADEYTVKMDQPYYSTAITMICGGGVQPTIGQRFYLENDLILLDEWGEFYFDKDTKIIYYMPFNEEDMSEVRAVIGRTENILSVKGTSESSKVKNVTFSDISFRYGGYYTEINREGAVSFQAENIVDADSGLNQNPVASVSGGRTLDAQLVFENAQNISFENCDISCMGSTALRLGKGVTDSAVTGCTFSDNGGGAITIGSWKGADALAENVALTNNVIYNQGIDFMFCPAVSVYYAKDIDVLHNTICKTPYSGISVNWGWESEVPKNLGCGGHNISYNRIYDISNSVVDGGHIYNVGYMEDVLISNNYLSESNDLGGIYFDTGSNGATVTGNVIETTQYWLFGGFDADNNKVYDNYSDTGTMRYSGIQTSDYFEEAIVCAESWNVEAQSIIDQAGVEADYLDKLDIISTPDWRTIEHHERPTEELREAGEIYVEAKDYTSFYIKEADADNKTIPALHTYSGITGVGDFRQGEWLEYTFDVDTAGTYTLDFYYSTGLGDTMTRKIDIFLNDDTPCFDDFVLPLTDTEWTAYIPATLGSVTLKEGSNTLKILNVGTSFGYCGFSFVPISSTN
ncbi:MAG: right-handed parallel beta-helix repeat-containing protein, partial [Clostridia bacterium]|nr:right-handed parallel beta-helix repeat-containing protein [Clostridia bacterium]